LLGSTPDWHCGPYGTGCTSFNGYENGGNGIAAQSGTYYAGIWDEEGIFYDIGSSGFRTSIYKMSYWHRPGDVNAYINPFGGTSIYLTTVAPTNISCTDFAGGYKLKIYESIEGTIGWKKKEFIFSAFNRPVVPYRYLVFTGLRDGECERYMSIDNTRLEDLCCGDYQLYQNFPLQPQFSLPVLTRRSDYIKAGYNVGAVHHAPGNVTVRSSESVTFQAGNQITLEPGFIVEPGAVFKAEIKSCDNFADNYGESPELLFHTNAAFFDCTGTATNNAGFASIGASYYRVKIFDRWGEMVLDKMDMINEVYTVYSDGSDISSIAQLNGVFTVELEIFNCNDSHYESFSVTYEYTGGCSPMGKKEVEAKEPSQTKSSEKDNYSLISIGPNPTKDIVTLSCNNTQLHTSLIIMNQLSNTVLEIPVDFSQGDVSIDMGQFSTGVYYFRTKDNITFNTNKIIKCD
jgi:hypothetical protein